MRTFNGLSGEAAGFPYYQGGLYRRKHRSGEKKEKSPSTRRGNNDFLTGRILPVAAPKLNVSTEQGETNVATAANYRYLLACADNYAKLTGQQLKIKKGKTPSHSINILYEALDTIIPQLLNIEMQDGKPVFCLYEYHKWDDYTFFWLPIRFTESLPPALQRITRSFIHSFVRHHGLNSVNEMPFFDYVVEYLTEMEVDEDSSPKQCRQIAALARSYAEGNICRKLKKIYDEKGYYQNLPRAITRYQPANETEKELLALISSGMELITAGQPSIQHYQYDPDEMEEPDFPPMELDRIILLTYDTADRVNGELMDSANAELRESYALSPATTCYLTPDIRVPFRKDDYPERFCRWFTDFSTFINDNF